jgi:hypothetical protein
LHAEHAAVPRSTRFDVGNIQNQMVESVYRKAHKIRHREGMQQAVADRADRVAADRQKSADERRRNRIAASGGD